MNIRKANKLDKDEVLNFCKNTFEWGDYIDRVWDLWEIDSSGLLLVSEVLDDASKKFHPIAISRISVCPNNLSWIEGLRVNKKYRNQGIGSSLLKYMLDFGIKKGFREANAIVSYNNIPSQKMLEKQGFSPLFKFNYYSLKLNKIIKINQLSPQQEQQKLEIKSAYPKDIASIIDYLSNSKVSKYMDNRYFDSWKFYRFKNTFSGIMSLINDNKVLLIVDEINKINGILIINIVDNKDAFFKKPLIQICYFDCIQDCKYSEIINILFSTFSENNLYYSIQFYLPDIIDLSHHLHNFSTDYFEQFILYSKKLYNSNSSKSYSQ
jgi:GNAT superfamily N-acetyltransferase